MKVIKFKPAMLSLENRVVPSVVPITVDKPDEDQPASADYQHAYDQKANDTLAIVSPDDTLPPSFKI